MDFSPSEMGGLKPILHDELNKETHDIIPPGATDVLA